MKPAPFQYYAPGERAEALALLAEHGGEAKILAGGQSLVPSMNFRLAQPSILVDLNGVADLFGIREGADGGVVIGAMTRQRTVERSALIAARAPLVAETMPHIAHPQIRNRGTFGGSLAHADPAAELPALAVALDAQLRAQRADGERLIPAAEFFQALFTTALEPEEMLVEVIIPPLPARTGTAFEEVARRHGDYALAGAAAVVTLDESGAVAASRLVFLSIGDVPLEATSVTAALQGRAPTAAAIADAAHAIDADIDPNGDIHATAAYRRHLAQVLARRTLTLAAQRAGRLSQQAH
jgi:aerobic carbon-monoxide dehydrogenase medium subunit